MYRNKKIAIVLSDTLRSLGLQNLLINFFPPVEVTHFISSDCLFSSGNTDVYDYYFTDANTFVMNTDFFLPRRSKTVVLIDKSKHVDSSIKSLCVYSSVENLIEELQELFKNDTINSSIENNKDLSSREIEVLQLIVKGITNKEIADRLNISLNTVLTHRKNLTTKLGIKTVSGLTFYAIMNGLISGDDITL